MTENKRFTYDKPLVAFSKGGISDNVTGETYEFTMDTVLDLLNELQMKYEAQKELYCQLDCVKNQLYEENEQLKQQIQQLQYWNKCLAEKRHQELSYRPYTTGKSEKKLKELLKPKVLNCSDRGF